MRNCHFIGALTQMVIFCVFSTADLFGQQISNAHLKESVNINLGGHQLTLPSGTTVQVLQQTTQKTVISVRLGDGSPIITQILTSDIDFPIPKPIEPPSASVTNSGDQTKPSNIPADNTMSPSALSSESSSRATTIPTDSTTANNILKSSNTSAIDATNSNQPSVDIGAILSRAGAPVQIDQPDFPEPDVNFQPKQYTIDISNHPDIVNRVKVVYTIPLDKDGKPGPRAHHIIFYCPWYEEPNPLGETYCKFLSGNLGLTVVSLNISWDKKSKSPNPVNETGDKKDSDINLSQGAVSVDEKENISPDALTDIGYAQQDIYSQLAFEAQSYLESKYNFAHERLILVGLSSGSDMAERMAVLNQDKVACVALMSGAAYMIPSVHFSMPWFVLYTRGDLNGPSNEQLIDALQKTGTRPTCIVTEPNWNGPVWEGRGSELFHHVISEDGFHLCEAYIWDVIKQLDASGVSSSKPVEWPFLSTMGFPGPVYKNNSNLLGALPSSFFPLPGTTSTFYYSKLQVHHLVTSTDYKKELWSIKPIGKPKGIILYSDAFNYLTMARIMDDMYYFADNGYYTIFTKGNSIDISDLINWIQSNQDNRDVPLYLIAFKDRADADLKLARMDLKGKFRAIALLNYPVASDGITLGELKQPDTDCPVLYVFDSTLSGLTEGRIQELKDYVSNPPLKSFRSKFALITDSKNNEDISADRAVNLIKPFFDVSQ